jgi:tetratricopeptide (TPR) repeat protein
LQPADETDAIALALLARAAHFAPGEPLPRDLLLAALHGDTEDEHAALDAVDALYRLLSLGLLETTASTSDVPDALTSDLRLHRLLAKFVETTTLEATIREARSAVVRTMLSKAKQSNEQQHPLQLLPLQVHLSALGNKVKNSINDEQAAALTLETGRHFRLCEKYDEALPYIKRAVSALERLRGNEHPDIGDALKEQADCLSGLVGRAAKHHGRELYEEAYCSYERTLEIYRSNPERGEEHEETLKVEDNMAALQAEEGNRCQDRGLLEAALSRHQRVLEIRRRVLVPDHVDDAATINNIASCYLAMEQYDDALCAYREILQIFESEVTVQGGAAA